jgi:hypothetical protein
MGWVKSAYSSVATRQNGGKTAANRWQKRRQTVIITKNGDMAKWRQISGKTAAVRSGRVFLSQKLRFLEKNFQHHYAT